MKNTFDKKCFDQSPYYQLHYVEGYNVGKAYSQGLHYDTRLTLAYFKNGSGCIKIEGITHEISDGDIFIVGYDELHSTHLDNDKYAERLILYVDERILDNFPCEKDDFFGVFHHRKRGVGNKFDAECVRTLGIDKLFEKVMEYTIQGDGKDITVAICKIVELLEKLNSNMMAEAKNEDIIQNTVISDVIKYISNHFTENISCEVIADEFHMSKCHLMRIFKKAVGLSLWDYVISRRILFFNELVINGESLNDACYKCGFSNYSNFYRLYKKHMNISPNEFKKK